MHLKDFNSVSFIQSAEDFQKLVARLREDVDTLMSRPLTYDGVILHDSKKAAELLCMSVRTLYRHRSNGYLKYYKIGGKVYYKDCDLREFIREWLNRENREEIRFE